MRDYNKEAVEAAQSVLIELVHVLGEYRDCTVVVGGWVPKFICPEPIRRHIGSMDVDLALDHRSVTGEGYQTIRELLLDRGYELGSQPFMFFRTVTVGGREVKVEVDLLGGEYEGTGRWHRTQRVQNVRVRKARGVDLAFEAPHKITLEGQLPDGAKDRVKVQVASIVSFVAMKAMALDDRLKEKDSWDIYYCLVNYPGGVDRVIEEFLPHIGHGLVKEGLEKLNNHFVSVEDVGPRHVVAFEEVTDAAERDRLRRDAYERVNYLLEQLGIR